MKPRTQAQIRPFTGWHMVLVVGLFFGTIISVNLTMAYLAGHSWSGLVVDNSYVASQHFNEKTATAQQQAALGWQSHLTVENGLARWSLRDATGAPVTALAATVRYMRPVRDAEDQAVQMIAGLDGSFTAAAPLAAGLWAAELTVITPKGVHYRDLVRFIAKE